MRAPASISAGAHLSSASTRVRANPRKTVLLLLPLLIPVALLLPGILKFPYPSPNAPFSDLTITHYPNAVYLRDSLLTYRSIPLWSPTILSGFPFAANPLSGLWYPFGWLALLTPLPFGFNLLVGLHLLWGGIGFYRLMQTWGLRVPAALLGGLAFTSMPKIFAHYGAGHITLIYAMCWTPWLLLVSDASRNIHIKLRIRDAFIWALPAVVLALIFLADVRWSAYAALLWVGYTLWQWWEGRNQVFNLEARAGIVSPSISLARAVWELFLLTALAFMLAAPLALPLVEYTALSTRSALAQTDVLAYSLPPARLLGIIFPDLGGVHEWVLYPGWVVLALGLLAVLHRRTRAWFWVWVAVLSLLFSLGEYLPLMQYTSRLPLFDLLRVPPRSLFLFGLALAVLAGYGLEALLSGIKAAEAKRARLLFIFLIGVCTMLAGLAAWFAGSLSINFAWGLAALTASVLLVWLSMERRIGLQMSLVGLFALCVVDLAGVSLSLFAQRSSEDVLSEGAGVVEYLSAQQGLYRVYSPSYSLPQQSAVRGGLQLADGVDPLQLQSYAAFMQPASGVPDTGYSVTLPPFQDNHPSTANADYLPRPDLLGLLNVRFVAAEFDLNVPGLILRRQAGSTRLYENIAYRPRAWVQPFNSTEGTYAQVDALHWEPNRIEVDAAGPGLLVLSEIQYPGWQVLVDGERQEMQTVSSILRGVNLPPGEHHIVFRFRPVSVYAGIGLLNAGMLLIFTWGVWSVRRSGNG